MRLDELWYQQGVCENMLTFTPKCTKQIVRNFWVVCSVIWTRVNENKLIRLLVLNTAMSFFWDKFQNSEPGKMQKVISLSSLLKILVNKLALFNIFSMSVCFLNLYCIFAIGAFMFYMQDVFMFKVNFIPLKYSIFVKL